MSNVTRMRPKRLDLICDSLQLCLDLPLGLKQETRDDIAGRLAHYAPPERWRFVMLNPEQQRMVLRAINASDRPNPTKGTWLAAISYLDYDTGEIMADRHQLAEDAGIHHSEVSRALNVLADIGALIRIKPGRYKINPHVGWTGDLHKRSEAAKDAPQLQLVDS